MCGATRENNRGMQAAIRLTGPVARG